MTSSLPEYLDTSLRAAGIPIIGVHIGLESDRSTWVVEFQPSATAADRTAAATLIATLDTSASKLEETAANDRLNDQALKAIVLWCAQKFGLTAAQAKAEIVAIYKTL